MAWLGGRFVPALTGIGLATIAAVSPACSQGGDVLQLEPSFTPRSTYTSACMPSEWPSLCVRLTDKSAAEFAGWTKDHVGKRIDVKVNDKVISSPRLLSPLTGGLVQLIFTTQSEADATEQELRNGGSVLTVNLHE